MTAAELMQLFDDLVDFGAFDGVVAGDVRDPYTELARLRRDEPVRRIDLSGMPTSLPVLFEVAS